MTYQQPQGDWPGQHGYQQPYPQSYPQSFTQPPAGSAALAIVAAILGLTVSGTLGYQSADVLMNVQDGAKLPTGWIVMIILHVVVVAVALLGAILVFARRVAGAVVLVISAVVTLVVVALDPFLAQAVAATMAGATPDVSATSLTAAYYELLVEFGNEQAVLRFAAVCAAAILLVIAALPPSVNYLRGSRRST
jgi:hypothetical protein